MECLFLCFVSLAMDLRALCSLSSFPWTECSACRRWEEGRGGVGGEGGVGGNGELREVNGAQGGEEGIGEM